MILITTAGNVGYRSDSLSRARPAITSIFPSIVEVESIEIQSVRHNPPNALGPQVTKSGLSSVGVDQGEGAVEGASESFGISTGLGEDEPALETGQRGGSEPVDVGVGS